MANPVVTITMDNGDVMKAELYPQIAPNTVNNFISLVNKGFYDGKIFHRVISGFMIQGGDPLGTGMGGSDHAGLCRLPVLYHACHFPASGRCLCRIWKGDRGYGCCEQDRGCADGL